MTPTPTPPHANAHPASPSNANTDGIQAYYVTQIREINQTTVTWLTNFYKRGLPRL